MFKKRIKKNQQNPERNKKIALTSTAMSCKKYCQCGNKKGGKIKNKEHIEETINTL